jgi:hypothetical protein
VIVWGYASSGRVGIARRASLEWERGTCLTLVGIRPVWEGGQRYVAVVMRCVILTSQL